MLTIQHYCLCCYIKSSTQSLEQRQRSPEAEIKTKCRLAKGICDSGTWPAIMRIQLGINLLPPKFHCHSSVSPNPEWTCLELGTPSSQELQQSFYLFPQIWLIIYDIPCQALRSVCFFYCSVLPSNVKLANSQFHVKHSLLTSLYRILSWTACKNYT